MEREYPCMNIRLYHDDLALRAQKRLERADKALNGFKPPAAGKRIPGQTAQGLKEEEIVIFDMELKIRGPDISTMELKGIPVPLEQGIRGKSLPGVF